MRRRSEPHAFDKRLNAEKARIEAELEATGTGPQRDLLELKLRQIETALILYLLRGYSRTSRDAESSMKDMQASLKTLLTDAAEAALIRDLATDSRKRELFTRPADHFATLAAEVERAISTHETGPRAASTDLNVGSWHFSNTPRSPTFCPLSGRADIPPQSRAFRF